MQTYFWNIETRSVVQIAADNNRDEDSFNSFNKIAILKIKVQMKDL